MKRALALAWVLLTSAPAIAIDALKPLKDLQDFRQLEEENSFAAIKNPWSIQAVAELPSYSFYLGAPNVDGVSYQPNVNVRLGTRILYKNFGATLVLPLPLPEVERTRRGDSSQTSFVFNKYWRQHAADVYYQRFRGFYVASPWDELGNRPKRYPQLPDALVHNMGLTWYYAVSPEQYSLKAAFSQTELQSKSGGSWLYAYFYNRLSVNLGSRFFLGTDPNSLQSIPNLAVGAFDTLGMGGGYGYTLIHKRYFMTGQLIFCPALQYQNIDKPDGPDATHLALAAKGNLNLAVGWNDDDVVAGFKILLDSIYSRVDQTQIWSSLPLGQAFVGGRF